MAIEKMCLSSGMQGDTDGRNVLVMVDGGDEVSGVLGDVHVIVPLALQQLRLAVGQVRAQHSLDDAVIVGLVELVQTGGEQREGAAGKDVTGAAHLQLVGNVQHGLAGGNDVVGNNRRAWSNRNGPFHICYYEVNEAGMLSELQLLPTDSNHKKLVNLISKKPFNQCTTGK